MHNLADLRVFVVVMNELSGAEMELPREQQTHNEGMLPEPEPRFLPALHSSDLALPWDRTKRPVVPYTVFMVPDKTPCEYAFLSAYR
jgi:hypothetical protein